MQEFPSIEDIYDLSSEDLNSITIKIDRLLADQHLDTEAKLKYQEYLESIHIQIQERKTLEFFRDLCEIDNPYLKKVTDFNNEFLKLAAEAIQLQQLQSKTQHNQHFHQKNSQKDEIKEDNQNQNDGASTTSEAITNTESRISKAGKTNFTQNNASVDKNQKNESQFTQKTMGIGKNLKKGKNQMKDFILSTLNKNKMQSYVVKSSNVNPDKKLKPIVDERGHIIKQLLPNGEAPLSSTKSIKSSQSKQKDHKQKRKLEPIPQIDEHISAQMLKKQEQLINKTRGIAVKNKEDKDKPSVKGKKKNSDLNKMLVEMVKKEEDQKKEKELIKLYPSVKVQQKQISNEKNSQNQKPSTNFQTKIDIGQNNESKTSNQQSVKLLKKQKQMIGGKESSKAVFEERKTISTAVTKQELNEQIQQELQGNIENDESIKEKDEEIKEQILIVEQPKINHALIAIKTKELQNIQIKNSIKSQMKRELSQKTSQPQPQFQNDPIKTHKSVQIIVQNQKKLQNFKKSSLDQHYCQDVKKDVIYAAEQVIQLDYNTFDQMIANQRAELLKMRQESELENLNAVNNIYKPAQKMDSNFGKIIDQEQKSHKQIVSQVQKVEKTEQQLKRNDQNLKKCYNEEYWIHIREEAELKIQRFKEQKELLQQARTKRLSQIEKQQKDSPNSKQNAARNDSNLSLQEDQNIQKQKQDLAKMIRQHNKKQQTKKPQQQIAAVPKIIYPKPEFNYLQIYPSLNHIFSVMYTKPENQALMDIPMIMKDLSNMFSTHQQHFKDKGGSIFQPAIFLPFDHSNNLQLTDPRQLLLHAENTYVNLKSLVERLEIFNGNLQGSFNTSLNRYYRVVKTKEEVYDIITTAFLRRKGWKELPHGCSLRSSWNLFWSWSKPQIDISKLLVWQRINHFPFNKNLSRKDLLYKNLDAFRKNLKIPFNFLPLTFNLPKEFTQFSMKFHEQQITNRDANYWIMKPIGKSRGRGIKVINSLAELNYTDNIVVQKYIANPLLLDGYKFDMRIYVLVTNFHPLEAFVYKEGFARLSTQKFSMEPMFIKNTFIHLTNFAIQKNNVDAKITFSGGSKISLKVLKDKITKMGYSFNAIWSQVHEIIVKSLLGCSISVPPFPTAFQLFGYDIMIDTDSNCHLIEINASPSLQRSYLIDEIVKQSLIDDILDIVDPPDFDKEALLDILSDRMNKNNSKKKFTAEDDLTAIARILKYQKIRKVGEVPEKLGLFQMIAPSKMSNDIQKLIKTKSGANNPHNID